MVVRTRKPYTITKQRERWTEEEHNRFLEALKLYGRAWQRIEEHIGTKTAVQIRSHAQKFFSKLEKEALTKGVPLGQAYDIDIPPPRPKRKPSNPYPRKSGAVAPTCSSVGANNGKSATTISSGHSSKVLDLENDPPTEEPPGTGSVRRTKQTPEESYCSEVHNLFQEAPSPCISSASKASLLIPVEPNEKNNQTATDESSLIVQFKEKKKRNGAVAGYKDLDIDKCDQLNSDDHSQASKGKICLDDDTRNIRQLKNPNEMHSSQNHLKHIFVEVQTPPPEMNHQVPVSLPSGAHANSSENPSAAANSEHHTNTARSIHQPFPIFHPSFNPFCHNQDVYQTYLNTSSTLSSLIISALLQNQAAHAGATMTAAAFWQHADESLDTLFGGFPMKGIGPSPSLAAIAATTVAAASAWWASHGLLPLCLPLHTGFTRSPAPTSTIPITETAQLSGDNKESELGYCQDNPREEEQVLEPEISLALKSQCSLKKSSSLSSSVSEDSGVEKSQVDEQKTTDHEQKPESSIRIRFHDSENHEVRKQVDRSSCGSNTPSSSEVEQDVMLEDQEGKAEHKEGELSHITCDPLNHRSRSSGNNDSWKEVSEEGRLAFQALFSRQVLPQSFPPSHDLRNQVCPKNDTEEGKWNLSQNNEVNDELELELSSKTWATNLDHPGYTEKLDLWNTNPEMLLKDRPVGHNKLKARRTGFKPYKRCSSEAKESRLLNSSNQAEENGAKRIRLESEAST